MLSVCIVSYNVREFLRNCLQSVYSQASGIDLQVIVVDNSSDDGSTRMVREEFPNVILIENHRNVGFAKAMNQAIRETTGNYILLLNPDTLIMGDAISKTLSFMERTGDAGIVGCRIANPDGSVQLSCKNFPSMLDLFLKMSFLYKLFPHNRFFGRPYMSYFNYGDTREVDVVMGAFMMTHRNMIDDIGLLDEQYYMYSEEVDWCWTAKQKGWKVYFYPAAEIVHYGGQSTKSAADRMFVELQKSECKFFRKHHRPEVALSAKALLFIGMLTRAVLWSTACAVNSKRYRERRRIYLSTVKWFLRGGEA